MKWEIFDESGPVAPNSVNEKFPLHGNTRRDWGGRGNATKDEAARAGLGGTSQFGGLTNPAAVARRFAPTSTLDKVRTLGGDALGAPLHLLERVGEASDRSPRLAEYIAAMREAEPRIKSGEWTPADARLFAATRARGVTIDFVPSLDDWKVAWDFVHFEGFLGARMSMQFTWQGNDSALAAPLVLDLARLASYAQGQGESGLMTHLAAYFKSPAGVEEQGFVKQLEMLEAYVASHRPRRGKERPATGSP